MSALAVIPPAAGGSNLQHYRASTDAAAMCRDIVVATSQKFGDRNYVAVEGWQAIAIAHGCTASARDVERVQGGYRCTGQVKRMSDGAVIAEAEGFIGEDEATWFGGESDAWRWGEKRGEKVWYKKTHPKRPDYAIRAMCATRAISRACRSAFAHVVVMMNANLQTTPAEEVPDGGFRDNFQNIDDRRDDDTSGPRPNRDAAIQRMRDDDDARDPANFSPAAALLQVKAAFDAARNKAGLDLAWTDTKVIRAKIRHAEPERHEDIVTHFAERAKAIAAALEEAEARSAVLHDDDRPPGQQTVNDDLPPGQQAIDVNATKPFGDAALDDNVPY